MKKLSILLFILTITIISCKKNCVCTEKGCPCPVLTILVEANVGNNIEGSFTEQEIDNFYLILTDNNFKTIDSVKLEFGEIVGNIDYNRIYWINKNTFSDFKDFRNYNLLIRNDIVKSTDTISAINYTEKMETVLCNTCTNCDDEYVNCMQYSNFSLEFNSTLQDDYKIRIKK